ncbi:hypothetical protein [Sphingobium ummariense]|uniref:Uncharacterized protein n=1 Tax=Sphingobium ummariense RL-3 TaxID=1346791 RepID=T0J2G0_9SPHN|nr:hypothetical protein [Sphingobium ummariense]EQB32131.1 hypothetical protein M529_11125 [Sphingobium ummariense RL-3]
MKKWDTGSAVRSIPRPHHWMLAAGALVLLGQVVPILAGLL